MTKAKLKNTRKRIRRRKYPEIWDMPHHPADGTNRITKYTIQTKDKPCSAIYDILDAEVGPSAYSTDTLKTLLKDATEVFVWAREPTPEQKNEAVEAARDGVVVVVRTTPRFARSWRRTLRSIP
jgi:hypothetical protein